MVRIAGIERELSTLEVLFYQASRDEQIELASSCLALLTEELGGIEFTVEMETGSTVKITTSRETIIEKLDEIDKVIEEVEKEK